MYGIAFITRFRLRWTFPFINFYHNSCSVTVFQRLWCLNLIYESNVMPNLPVYSVQFSSFQALSCVRLFATPWIAARRASLSITNSRSSLRLTSIETVMPSSQWCHPAISSSVIPFSSCPQSLPASGSFPMSQLFAWGGQATGVSALASFPPKKSQGWSPLEWTGWISLQSKGLSRVFSNTTVQTHHNIYLIIHLCWCCLVGKLCLTLLWLQGL